MELGLATAPRLLVLGDYPDEARLLGFRGSPTVTVAGHDVAPPDQIPAGEAGLAYG